MTRLAQPVRPWLTAVRSRRVSAAFWVAALGTLAAAPAAAQCAADTARGYPVSVAWAEGGTADAVYLAEFARAAALRWQVPSPGRRRFADWRRVRERAVPLVPRWADDWTPGPGHRALLDVTVYRDGRPPAAVTRSGSGDDLFDGSLRSALVDPLPQAPSLPALPAGADSARLEIHFGTVPAEGAHRTVRFAARQSPVRVVPGTLRVERPREGGSAQPPAATVKYDVGPNGRVVPGSVQLLRTSDRAFGRAVADALSRASFTPAESNCLPITHTVLQSFGS